MAAYSGDHERSLAVNISGIADASRSGDTYDLVNLLVNSAVDLIYDCLDEAIAYADEAFDLTATLDVGPMLVSVLLIRGSGELPGCRRGRRRPRRPKSGQVGLHAHAQERQRGQDSAVDLLVVRQAELGEDALNMNLDRAF